VKIAILPEAVLRFNTVSMKMTMIFITEIEKSTLKFIWKHKRLKIAKPILSKRAMWMYQNT
jgi:hypothetical protein